MEEEGPLKKILWFSAITFLAMFIICTFNKQPIGAFLHLLTTFFIVFYIYCDRIKHKEILEQIIEKTLISVITALAVGYLAFLLKGSIANEVNNSIQQNELVRFYTDLSKQGKNEEVISGITNRLEKGGLSPSTEITLENIRKVSEDVVSVSVPQQPPKIKLK